MVTFEHGVLTIEKSRPDELIRSLYEICLFLSISGYFLFYNSTLHLVAVAFSFLGTGLIVLNRLLERRIDRLGFFLWYLCFILFSRMSSLWAFSAGNASSDYMNVMIFTMVLSFGVTQYINTKNDLEKILRIYCYAALAIALAQFLFTPPQLWLNGYFGTYVGGNNSNTFGSIVLLATIISFYKAYAKQKNAWFILVGLFLICCILSSSRKSLLISVLGLFMIFLFSVHRKNRIWHWLIFIVLVSVLFILIMQEDTLYSLIGWRLKNWWQYSINGESVSEGSLPTRQYYIDFAKQLFKERPILGYGFFNFSAMLQAETYQRQILYAHNNYYELLADLGLVGFLLYYSFHIYVLIRLLYKGINNKFQPHVVIALVLVIAKLFCDWATVSIHHYIYQLILGIAYAAIFVPNEDRQYYYAGDQEQKQ